MENNFESDGLGVGDVATDFADPVEADERNIEFLGISDPDLEEGALALAQIMTDILSRKDSSVEMVTYSDLLQLIFDSGIGVSDGWRNADESLREKYTTVVWSNLSGTAKKKIQLLLNDMTLELSRNFNSIPIVIQAEKPEDQVTANLPEGSKLRSWRLYPAVLVGSLAAEMENARATFVAQQNTAREKLI